MFSYIKSFFSDAYEGEVDSQGLPSGKGKMLYKNGDIYEGEWKNGKKHGIGEMRFLNNHTYIGEWENDKYNGKGLLQKGEFGSYDGEWKNGFFHGVGTFNQYDISRGEDNKYVGEWKNGNRHGKGVSTALNSVEFDKNGVTTGRKYFYTYEGEFSNNKKNGNGKAVSKNPEHVEYEGIWKDNEFIIGTAIFENRKIIFNGNSNKTVIEHCDGTKFIGRVGNYSGIKLQHEPIDGKMIFTDGSIYEGSCWLDAGTDTFTFPTGEKVKILELSEDKLDFIEKEIQKFRYLDKEFY